MGMNEELTQVLHHQTLITHFQPIFSIAKQQLVGLEALSRGYSPQTGKQIAPLSLFEQAHDKETRLQLDRLCREKAIKTFAAASAVDTLLFINLDAVVIDNEVVGSNRLLNEIQKHRLAPAAVIIEITESPSLDIKALTAFINLYRAYGFLIALDDVGSACSNLDRMLQLRPDIIKIDRALLQQIHEDRYKQALFSALTNCAKQIGALVVAEGIETEEEAVTALRLGADFLQGYYLQRPVALETLLSTSYRPLLQQLSLTLRLEKQEKLLEEKHTAEQSDNLIAHIVEALHEVSFSALPDFLPGLLRLSPSLQCLYVLDASGRQLTETFFAPTAPHTSNALFTADAIGADQSLKDYYLHIQAGFARYRSQPYRSLANGLLCVTCAALFRPAQSDHPLILCLDLNP